MEREAHHAEQVVGIEPGALAVGLGSQGEEILEDPPVDDQPRYQRDEHEHARQTDDVHADVARVQVVVQLEEEISAEGLRHGIGPCAPWIEGHVMEGFGAVHLPAEPPVGFPCGGAVHPERMQLLADVALQPVAYVIGALGRDHAFVQCRAHPAVELLVEAGHGAGEDDHVEQPARQQPAPGVQPDHALAQIHGRFLQSAARNAARHSTTVRPTSNSHTRVALRAANT